MHGLRAIDIFQTINASAGLRWRDAEVGHVLIVVVFDELETVVVVVEHVQDVTIGFLLFTLLCVLIEEQIFIVVKQV